MPDVMIGVVVICVLCAVISTVVVLVMWNQQRPGDIQRHITEGDAAVRQHLDAELSEVKEEVTAVREALVRMEERQRAEDRHALQRSDLEPLHVRTQRLAEQQAEMRGELTEVTRMLREQLRILQVTHRPPNQ